MTEAMDALLLRLSKMEWPTPSTEKIDSEILFGALLGACLAYNSRRHLKAPLVEHSSRPLKFTRWQRLYALTLCVGVGYLFAPLILALAPFLSSGEAAFVASVVVIPISLKVMLWLDHVQLQDLLEKWRKGR
ncbi:putative holin [Pseudomonas sp. NPDC089554]|uniref:putative holin n=1 Tax=Pseudomonas sp. NPDC089554 TaxID=3390653 RepID=UPI003CFCFCFB